MQNDKYIERNCKIDLLLHEKDSVYFILKLYIYSIGAAKAKGGAGKHVPGCKFQN